MSYPIIYTESDPRKCISPSPENPYVSWLEIPSGKDPKQNAWLTIILEYSLNFVDRNNPTRHPNGEPIILGNRGEGHFLAIDTDKKRFRALDWDSRSKQVFHEKFKKAESFWNHKFLLETPANYADLDFRGSDGWMYRPNILCLFRLKEHNGLLTKRINVVRADTVTEFRSNRDLYNHTDVNTYEYKGNKNKVAWHELGHALNQLHIQTLAETPIGETLCVDEPGDKACYVTPPWMPPNIMGERWATGLHPVNAKPWLEQIQSHTNIDKSRWIARMSTKIPPRMIRRA